MRHVNKRLVKRSAACALIGRTPRTLRRFELQGILQPVKLNSRSTAYYEEDLLRLVEACGRAMQPEVCAITRTASGTFAKISSQ
jgi:hypothetical protein